MAVDRSHEARNDVARLRLIALVARMGDEELGHPLFDGWTVAAALAHLAFWDRYAFAVLMTWQRTGHPPRTGQADEINAASLPAWLAMPPGEAARSALAAAEAVDRHIGQLPDAMVAAIVATGRLRTLDRSLHRNDHLVELERVEAQPPTARGEDGPRRGTTCA